MEDLLIFLTKLSGHSVTDEQKEAVYGDSHFPANVVDGITKEYTKYTKINLFLMISLII